VQPVSDEGESTLLVLETKLYHRQSGKSRPFSNIGEYPPVYLAYRPILGCRNDSIMVNHLALMSSLSGTAMVSVAVLHVRAAPGKTSDFWQVSALRLKDFMLLPVFFIDKGRILFYYQIHF